MDHAFDLNVDRVLEHWTPAHAVRELIANALDEAALTGTADAQIMKDADGSWHIRDFGRGLGHEHLTQDEDQEKLDHADLVIGKFGIGLKDALAVFDRKGISIRIRSARGDMTLARVPKHGFEDITTLHVLVLPPSDPSIAGTDIALGGLKDRDVDDAKALFLRYAGDEVLERTPLGAVLKRTKGQPARIYVNGLRVAIEDRFLFSYDITSMTASLRRALNRERSNVGRTAYADRVKAILLAAESEPVADALATDLARYERGTIHDETNWLDVGLHACRILNAIEKVLFVTSDQIAWHPAYIDRHAMTATGSCPCPRRSPGSCPRRSTSRVSPSWAWTSSRSAGKRASNSASSSRTSSRVPNVSSSTRRPRSSGSGDADPPGSGRSESV